MGHHRLDELARTLEAQGADPERIAMVHRARRFKRSWVEMAEALVRVRETQSFREWGYDDLHSYAAEELQIRRPTVDKLTGSYMVLERHAPQFLRRESEEAPPSHDAVGYFARALRDRGDEASWDEEPADEVVRELRQAVFEEGAPVAVLRRRFDPVLFPKPDESEELSRLEKAAAYTRRLAAMLPGLTDLPEAHVAKAERALATLRDELTALIEARRGESERATPSAPARRAPHAKRVRRGGEKRPGATRRSRSRP